MLWGASSPSLASRPHQVNIQARVHRQCAHISLASVVFSAPGGGRDTHDDVVVVPEDSPASVAPKAGLLPARTLKQRGSVCSAASKALEPEPEHRPEGAGVGDAPAAEGTERGADVNGCASAQCACRWTRGTWVACLRELRCVCVCVCGGDEGQRCAAHRRLRTLCADRSLCGN